MAKKIRADRSAYLTPRMNLIANIETRASTLSMQYNQTKWPKGTRNVSVTITAAYRYKWQTRLFGSKISIAYLKAKHLIITTYIWLLSNGAFATRVDGRFELVDLRRSTLTEPDLMHLDATLGFDNKLTHL